MKEMGYRFMPVEMCVCNSMSELGENLAVDYNAHLCPGCCNSPPTLTPVPPLPLTPNPLPLPAVPGAPSNVSFPDVSYTFARVIWEEPAEPNGLLLGYKVTYHPADSTDINITHELPPESRTYK